MNIDEFRDRLYELGTDTIKKTNDYVSAQNNLFDEGTKAPTVSLTWIQTEEVLRSEQAWKDASAKYFEFLRYGHDCFAKN